MKISRGQLLFSPSDLTEFMVSEFARWMSPLRAESPERFSPIFPRSSGGQFLGYNFRERRGRNDEFLDLWRNHGFA